MKTKERMREYNRRAYEKLKARLAVDPDFAKQWHAERAAKSSAYRERQLADPKLRDIYLRARKASKMKSNLKFRQKIKARRVADAAFAAEWNARERRRKNASYQLAKQADPARYEHLKAVQAARTARNRKPHPPEYYRAWRAKRKAARTSLTASASIRHPSF